MSAGICGKLNDARQMVIATLEAQEGIAGHPVMRYRESLLTIDRLITEALDCIPAPKSPVMDDHDGGFNACLAAMGAVTSSDKEGRFK